jgi:xanthine dehydrogenase accessory factor
MSTDVLRIANELVLQGRPFVLATVVRVEGSSSARRGSKAIIDADGRIVTGWVGGGCAESAVRHQALKCIASGEPQVITLDMTDELLGVGMPCGGVMDVYIEPVLPKPELLIVGHGRIAETLAALGTLMGFTVTVNDPGADRKAFPTADRLITDDMDLNLSGVNGGMYVVIATQHKNDHVSLLRAIEGRAKYIALISSKHRADLVLDYLAAVGVPAERLAHVWAPAGLDIGAATPEEIALSIMSQIVGKRRGASVEASKRPLSHRTEEPVRHIIKECDLHLPRG